jgi:CRP-like cAMP-binding protein
METHSLARVLKEHALIKDLSDSYVEFLSSCARSVRVHAGEFLFREGQPADELFLVRSGEVALEIQDSGRGTRVVETLGPDDAMGWSTLFPPYRWDLDARVKKTAQVFVIDGKCLRGKLDADPGFGYAFTRRLLFEVHARLERVRLQILDVYGAAS